MAFSTRSGPVMVPMMTVAQTVDLDDQALAATMDELLTSIFRVDQPWRSR